MSERVELREELILAVIATIGVVGDVQRVGGLVRFDAFVTDRVILDKCFRHRAIVRGIAGGKRGDSEGAFTERTLRGPRQIGGIGAARKRDEQGIEAGERGEQAFFFGCGIALAQG